MNAQHHFLQLFGRPVFVILDKLRQTTAIPAVTRGLLDHFPLNHPDNDEIDQDPSPHSLQICFCFWHVVLMLLVGHCTSLMLYSQPISSRSTAAIASRMSSSRQDACIC